MRLRAFKRVLAPLAAMSLVACGASPSAPAPEAPRADALGAVPANPGTAAPGKGQSQLWRDPIPDDTPVNPGGDGAPPEPADPAAPAAPASAAPPPAGPAPAGGLPVTPGNLIAFSSTAPGGGGGFGFDIFVFDRAASTVFAVPGVNTPANETNADLSHSGRYLVYNTDVNGNLDIHLFDMTTAVINVLTTANTIANESQPSVSDDGNTIAYTSSAGGFAQLRIHDVATNQSFIPPAVAKMTYAAFDPDISPDGRVVAFAARDSYSTGIYVYNLGSDAVLRPPFIDTPFNEVQPELSADGSKLLYVSDQTGRDEIYLADLASGMIDKLSPLNAAPGGSTSPRFLADGAILFQSNRMGPERLFIFQPGSTVVDTLPIVNEIGQDTIIEDQVGTPAGPSIGFGIGRGFFGR